jgi:hypothetical protein
MQNEMTDYGYMKKGGNWIQKATASIKRRGTEGVCTGAKFGGPTCPPGSKRYNLAQTFKKMAKSRKGQEGMYMAEGGYKDNRNTPAMSHPFKSSGLKLKESYLRAGGMMSKPKLKSKYGTK